MHEPGVTILQDQGKLFPVIFSNSSNSSLIFSVIRDIFVAVFYFKLSEMENLGHGTLGNVEGLTICNTCLNLTSLRAISHSNYYNLI